MCPECHKFFTCRFCHNDACTHEIDRYAVEYMACMYCFRIQVLSLCVVENRNVPENANTATKFSGTTIATSATSGAMM